MSTRTIYNHFEDKARLFQAVIQESATRVADGPDRRSWTATYSKVTDLEADLDRIRPGLE